MRIAEGAAGRYLAETSFLRRPHLGGACLVVDEIDIEALVATLERIRALARAFAAEVRAHFGERARRIVLYGSAARGDWGDESDVDILVLLDRVTHDDRAWLVERALEMGVLDSGVLLMPLPMSEEDFVDLRGRELLFPREVERDGIEL